MASFLNSWDPGNICGWAGFMNGALLECRSIKWGRFAPIETPWHGYSNDCDIATVIEKPQVYNVARSKGDPNDLIDLAIKVGMLCAWYPNHELVLPREWKGQLPKDVCWNRALEVLTPSELSVIKGSDHNMRDAIALGLWKLGRLKLA